ncbi:MAG TPA: GNAT family N-acetyltransferase [Verrucomicrobiae bacterium]|nr:GNAT family N-acetyltransferase [Verrucomicrobiae bacterium]
MTTNIDQEVRLPDAPPIPGLRFRMFDPARDYEDLVGLIREAHLVDGIDWIPTVENLRTEHEHGGEFDPRRDLLLALVDGTIVGASETNVRTRDLGPNHHVEGWVRPAFRRRGLGRALLHWAEARAREVALVDGRTGERSLSSWPDEAQAGAVALYESEGYAIVRYGFMMVRDLTEPIPELPLPDGLEVRPVDPADHRRIWDADAEAFLDHWNAGERTDADFEGLFASPELDTSLWRVAWDGDEVAGSVMNAIYPAENEALGVQRGWLDHVSVRRPWRRRGLASALIAESLRAIRDAGMTDAALGVDAENPTGALRVYENLGFRRARTGVSYRKLM